LKSLPWSKTWHRLQNYGVTTRHEAQTADGRYHVVDHVTPVRISTFGHECNNGASVIGNQVLLGAIPMDDMDLIVEPARLHVSVNPLSPNIQAYLR